MRDMVQPLLLVPSAPVQRGAESSSCKQLLQHFSFDQVVSFFHSSIRKGVSLNSHMQPTDACERGYYIINEW